MVRPAFVRTTRTRCRPCACGSPGMVMQMSGDGMGLFPLFLFALIFDLGRPRKFQTRLPNVITPFAQRALDVPLRLTVVRWLEFDADGLAPQGQSAIDL